ncbi:THO complex subunit 7-like protein [Microtus ochrogaster]|uniref:THO complex subunit 7-like protein n=1 Tax=Microtus ochrogaster TaxID=79684 RepID=A0A8J6KYE2_MICOH|nr:THO complex subunit 7-like protein [Microtus ochrogaster]
MATGVVEVEQKNTGKNKLPPVTTVTTRYHHSVLSSLFGYPSLPHSFAGTLNSQELLLEAANEVIRKRLLIDGDGAGDDRRINLLVKSFVKWCNSGSQEEGYSQYQRMLSTLSQCEFSMGKTLLVYDMNLREMENYEKIYKEIECSIAGAHEKIAECKKQILQAKRIRKNRQEYDALAKVIQHHPDRHETLKELEALGKELEHLSHIKESVEDKLELRRKQFHVLLSTIHELQQTLENDDKLSEVDEVQESTMETDSKS